MPENRHVVWKGEQVKQYRTAEEQERDSKLNLHQPHIEAIVWSADAARDESGNVIRGNLVAQIAYYPRTGTFYFTYGRNGEGRDDRFEEPLSTFLGVTSRYLSGGFQVDHAFKYAWEG